MLQNFPLKFCTFVLEHSFGFSSDFFTVVFFNCDWSQVKLTAILNRKVQGTGSRLVNVSFKNSGSRCGKPPLVGSFCTHEEKNI